MVEGKRGKRGVDIGGRRKEERKQYWRAEINLGKRRKDKRSCEKNFSVACDWKISHFT